MLDRLEASHFAPLLAQPQRLILPDGHPLPVRVDAIHEHPRSRMPGAPAERRTPFTVTLTALEPTAFIDGLCAIDLPALGRVDGIWVGRLAALGRDQASAYFQIVFN
ncbi:hypothetical protein QMK61_16050 [Fulvimonas sp. R45]|uniref:DUF6916 family protein n=1 Tax=Fulvimonas sp. R45 TaxID=3045937 RepID=UPI0026602ECF|nr:hypothetical protein [Fulvimonas sp. R45]MDO1530351.1 hypothetical protein [Fulvimonas sp. R45]